MPIDNDADLEVARETFLRIVGARLTSVGFIMNYMILGFDERGDLTVRVWPEFHENGNQISFGDASYRDKLCSLIESLVISTDFTRDETIIIRFDGGIELRIPLRMYQDIGERALYTASGGLHHAF